MPWYELESAKDPRLDELAKQYNLHPLHVEDCRSDNEGVKVDTGSHYTFAVFKPVHIDGDPAFTTIDIFAGKDFFITITEPACPSSAEALARARRDGSDDNPGKLLYLILDTIVDLYFPAIDRFDDRIDDLEDTVIGSPSPEILQSVFALKRELIDLRRVLANTRDASVHLQRDPGSIIDAEHQPYVRDIYLSSVANRTNEVMKVLTVVGTIALPVIAISGIYGMNLKGLPFEASPHGALYVGGVTISSTILLLAVLRKLKWF